MGERAYADDLTIADGAVLWRRIHPMWAVEENHGGLRVSSAAFDDSKDGSPTSVFIADIVRSTGRQAGQLLAGFKDYGLAALTAGQARAPGQRVARDPLPEEPAHAFIVGKKTKPVKRALAAACRWEVAPTSARTR